MQPFLPCMLLTTSSDLCSQIGASYTWMQKWTQGLGYLPFKEASRVADSLDTELSTLPSVSSTHFGLKLLLNVKNSTALKFKTHHIWKMIFIFPMSHSFTFSSSGDAKTSTFFERFQKMVRITFRKCFFFEALLDFGNKLWVCPRSRNRVKRSSVEGTGPEKRAGASCSGLAGEDQKGLWSRRRSKGRTHLPAEATLAQLVSHSKLSDC